MARITSDNGNDEYEIRLIDNERDAKLCAQLIAEEFAASNPLAVFGQARAQELYDAWLWPKMEETLEEKLSFLVHHLPTDQIVASIIASDLYSFDARHPYNVSDPPSYIPIIDLFSEMRDHFIHHDLTEKLEPNLVLAIGAGATNSAHARKGVASALRAHLCHHARTSRGFKCAFVQTIHPATRYIYTKKMNGKELTITDPATWLWKKKDDGSSRPLQAYQGEPIVNMLVPLT